MQVEKLGLLSKLEKSGLTLSKVGVREIFRCDGPTVLTLGLGKPPVRKHTHLFEVYAAAEVKGRLRPQTLSLGHSHASFAILTQSRDCRLRAAAC